MIDLKLFLILLVCLLWIVLTAINLRKTIIIFPFFFPLYLLKTELFSIPFYLPEMLLLISAIPTFYLILFPSKKSKGGRMLNFIKRIKDHIFSKEKSTSIDFLKSVYAPITLFLIASLVSLLLLPQETVYANDQIYGSLTRGLGIMKSWIIFPLIFFICFRKMVTNDKEKLYAVDSYLVSCLLLGLIGLYQLVSGDYLTIDARVSGPFISANYLALFISPAIVYSFIRIYFNYRFSIQYLLSFIFLFFILIFSVSYGGIFGVSGALLSYLIYRFIKIDRKKVNAVFAVIIISVIVIGGLGIIYAGQEKFDNLTKIETTQEDKSSIAIRMEVWEIAGKLILKNPITGIGLGRYEAEYIKNAHLLLDKEPLESVRLHSHNFYLETWLNTGIIGFIAMMWIIIWSIYTFWKARDPKNTVLKLGFFMLLVILFHGFIDTEFWKNDLAYLYWMIIALFLK